MKLSIISIHAKLSQAVKASGIDLSYNEGLALSDLARHDKDGSFEQAFVVLNEQGKVEVWYRYNCDIKLLNRYSPFGSMIHNGKFSTVSINPVEIEISEPCINRNARNLVGEYGFIVSLL